MTENKMTSRIEKERVLVLERVFNAPKELVYSMFKEPEHLKNWWGPRGFEVTFCTVDFKVDGVWHYCMKCVDKNLGDFYGTESWGKGVYKNIDEPNLISYTDYFSDENQNIQVDMPSTEMEIEFIEVDGKTKLISRAEYKTAEGLKTVLDMGMLQGITETWDRLEENVLEIQK